MPGKFYLCTAGNLINSEVDRKASVGRRTWDMVYKYVPKDKDYYSNVLEGRTGVAIFGPTQDPYLEAFLKADVKILFKSKKCVNPNHKGYLPEQRNTVVVFEALE